jgi:hypothetical protein
LHQILQTFTVGFFKYLKSCFSWMAPRKKWNCEGKLLHTHPVLFLYLWDKKKLVTNNKKLLNSYIWHNYQITAFVFFFFQVCWVGVVWGWLYLIDSLQIKQLYNSFIICKILVYIFNIFYLTNIKWKKSLSHKCVTLLAFFTTYFAGNFFWKEIFQWYFVDTSIW